MPNEIRIAVIGSRETDRGTMKEMYNHLLRLNDVVLSKGITLGYDSGGCWSGPDQLQFSLAHSEWGQRLNFKCYLPDNKKLAMFKARHHKTNIEFLVPDDTPARRDIVRGLHPAPHNLSEFAWLAHGRNCNIVAGLNLDRHVDFVYYSAELNSKGLPKGGTYMGVAYAQSVGVPTIRHGDGRELAWLEELKKL